MEERVEISSRAQSIVSQFNQFKEWEDKYREIIKIGKNLPEFPSEYRLDKNKVKGCQSQVWLFAELKKGPAGLEDRVIYYADSDASIVRGIIALLLNVYSDSTIDEVLNFKPDFIEEIGLKQHLSMSRANGLNSMIKQVVLYAFAFKHKQ